MLICPLVPEKVRALRSLHISNHSVRLQWREPGSSNGAIVYYTVRVQRYQPVSGSSKELELVAVNPEFSRNYSAATLKRLTNDTFVINISDGLGETMK